MYFKGVKIYKLLESANLCQSYIYHPIKCLLFFDVAVIIKPQINKKKESLHFQEKWLRHIIYDNNVTKEMM